MMSQQHTVREFDTELGDIRGAVLEMGRLAGGQALSAVKALLSGDVGRAHFIIEDDRRIDALQSEVEDKVFRIIARRQPVAHDLRLVIGAMRIANDLERIGDLGKNVAKRVLALDSPPHRRLVPGINRLRELVVMQLDAVMNAYAQENADAAEQVWRLDVEIDSTYTSLFRELLTYMMEDPRNIGSCAHLLFCAKNMERIGDHVTNIAETVIYMVTGELPQEERPKTDKTSLMPIE
ncbi:MAG: phosphate signaling complex protein PhoU [Chromatiales bacterium]|nr:phosphate signaling complex protein PhoU [Chromatiales bacterium]